MIIRHYHDGFGSITSLGIIHETETQELWITHSIFVQYY